MLESLKTIMEIMQILFGITVVLVGAIVGYVKFFKGRVFYSALQPEIKAVLEKQGDNLCLKTTVQVKNIGTTNATIPKGDTFLSVQSCKHQPGSEGGGALWNPVGTFKVLSRNSNVEPSETIQDEHLMILADHDFLALEVTLEVQAQKSPWSMSRKTFAEQVETGELRPGQFNTWTARQIVLLPAQAL